MSGVSARVHRFLGIFGFLLLDDLFLGSLFFRGWLCLGIESNCGPKRTSIGNSHNSSVQVRGVFSGIVK